ncbi:hypothetical protein [Brachybacterium saurashtrense]|uniref:Sugar ABC transporter ATPase n=1 Tax=Brachybacterium saurashtrense TaxID=556288 RepID=A0A345YRM3_9MICO|nr:hypothetical protein [Brachybacterium saurashtrense]AXK46575.1 hypothetical protein DWV08_13775 [Brachybacterium saurashtrense]RRR24316.1 hypothetical protein DXU92_05525 [Brachybacterium saurashtrense]
MTESIDPRDPALPEDPPSIDDALEADRVEAEGEIPRAADGVGVDADLERGGDDAAAAEQGNRDGDAMEADDEDREVEEILREDPGSAEPML